MRICCITTIEITQEQFVIPAMRQFVTEGHEVTLVCSMGSGFVEKYGQLFTCISVPMERGVSFLDLFKMPFVFFRLFKRNHFDLVQYATPNASFYASIGAYWARVPKRVYCQWGIRYVGSKGFTRGVLKLLEKLTCRLSTHIRPASRKNLDYAVSEGLYKKEKASVIGEGGTVGVDFSEFDISQVNANKSASLSEFPGLKGKVVFAFVGRQQRDKGIRELLEAFNMVAKEDETLALLIIGPKDDHLSVMDSLSEELLKRVALTGFTTEVPKFLSLADVLVHPSYREGFSMVIQQAMALGIPVITTDIPGPSEVIVNGESGILVPVRCVEPLADAMRVLAKDEDKRELMGHEGYKRAKALFERSRMIKLTYEDRMQIIQS